MKLWMWALVAAAVAGSLLLLQGQARPFVTVRAEGVIVKVTAPAEVVLVGALSANADNVSTTVPGSGTTVPASGTKWALPTWLQTPFARATLYALAGAAAFWALNLFKRRFGWHGKQMLNATILVVAAFGLLLSYLFQDKGISLLSNPLNVGGGIGLIYTVANLAYQYLRK